MNSRCTQKECNLTFFCTQFVHLRDRLYQRIHICHNATFMGIGGYIGVIGLLWR